MIYDLREFWNQVSEEFGLKINNNTNTKVIFDNIIGNVKSYQDGLTLLRAIFIIACRHNLLSKLKKCKFFPENLEFVGHDLCYNDNRPAILKEDLLARWPLPITVRNIHRFIGYGNFYLKHISYYKLRIKPLWE